MPKKKRLTILRGYPGIGKTTHARRLAKKYKMANIPVDYFTYALLPYEPRTKADIELSFENMMSALKNCMKAGKDIVVEGNLFPFSKRVRSETIVRLAKRNGYSVQRLLLVADFDELTKRMKKRGNVVVQKVRRELTAEIEASSPHEEMRIDTTKNSADMTTRVLEVAMRMQR